MTISNEQTTPAGGQQPGQKRVQIGWMNPTTGVMCDCPVYERSPHANSVPVYRETDAASPDQEVQP